MAKLHLYEGHWPHGGYEMIEAFEAFEQQPGAPGWRVIPSWGHHGWDLGEWPLTIIMHRESGEGPTAVYEVLSYVEGQVTVEGYSTRAERDGRTDQIAWAQWRHERAPWIQHILEGEEPAWLRGPFSWKRLERQRHVERFGKVSSRYPARVAEAYEGDLARALGDSDAQVAATVAAWERQRGLTPRDWAALGAAEHHDTP